MLDHSCTLQEMKEFLVSCENSVPIKDFNRLSNKRHIDLYRELRGKMGAREIEIYQHPDTGVARRKAKSAKGIIYNDKEHAVLVEVSRTYLNGKTVPNFEGDLYFGAYSISETLHLGEHSLACLLRGMREELDVNTNNINLRKIQETGFVHEEVHQSKAYAGVESEVTSTWYVIRTYQLAPRFMIPYRRDSGVLINRRWFIDKPEPLEQLEEQIG